MTKADAIQTLLQATSAASSRLAGIDCDVVTVAQQLRQTSELVLAELKSRDPVSLEDVLQVKQ